MLAYASVVLDGRVIGVVSSLPVLSDRRVGDRRAFSLGTPQILHTVHGDGEAGLYAAYLEEVERLGAEKGVLAIGDLMGALRQPAKGRVLDVDLPRLSASARRARRS